MSFRIELESLLSAWLTRNENLDELEREAKRALEQIKEFGADGCGREGNDQRVFEIAYDLDRYGGKRLSEDAPKQWNTADHIIQCLERNHKQDKIHLSFDQIQISFEGYFHGWAV